MSRDSRVYKIEKRRKVAEGCHPPHCDDTWRYGVPDTFPAKTNFTLLNPNPKCFPLSCFLSGLRQEKELNYFKNDEKHNMGKIVLYILCMIVIRENDISMFLFSFSTSKLPGVCSFSMDVIRIMTAMQRYLQGTTHCIQRFVQILSSFFIAHNSFVCNYKEVY